MPEPISTLWGIALGAATAVVGVLAWAFRLEGKANSAHEKAEEAMREAIEGRTHSERELAALEKRLAGQRTEDKAAWRRDFDNLGTLLKEVRNDIKELLKGSAK